MDCVMHWDTTSHSKLREQRTGNGDGVLISLLPRRHCPPTPHPCCTLSSINFLLYGTCRLPHPAWQLLTSFCQTLANSS